MFRSMVFVAAWMATAIHVVVGDCTRDFLKNASMTYVTAQNKGTPALIQAMASNLNYTENDKETDITMGVLSKPMKINHNISFHDVPQCAAMTELIITDPEAPYVIHTRYVFNATDLKLNLMESVVTKPGDWAFNATGYLYWDSIENWDPIPTVDQDSRAVIQAAGDAYFNKFDNASVVIPLGPECTRLEGGAYTGAGNLTSETCSIGGFPVGLIVTNRRYVVDEEYGIVDIFEGFPGLDRSEPDKPVPDSHLFRVEKGLIHYIHTVSACFHSGCGMNVTTFGGTTFGGTS